MYESSSLLDYRRVANGLKCEKKEQIARTKTWDLYRLGVLNNKDSQQKN